MNERSATEVSGSDVEWLHRFLNCTPFGPPPSEIQRAHQIVEALSARSETATKVFKAEQYDWSKPAAAVPSARVLKRCEVCDGKGTIVIGAAAYGDCPKCRPATPSATAESKTHQQFADCVRNLVNGSAFDLTDSPKSFISTVQRLVQEMDAALDSSNQGVKP